MLAISNCLDGASCNVLSANATPPATGEGEEEPVPFQVSLLFQPSLGSKLIRLWEGVLVHPVHGIGLTAHDRTFGEPVSVDTTTSLGNVSWQAHRDGWEYPETFLDHRVEVAKLVKRHLAAFAQLGTQTLLNMLVSGLGYLPHQKAESIACGLDASQHVVHAFCGDLDGLHAEPLLLHPVSQGEAGRGLLAGCVENEGLRQRNISSTAQDTAPVHDGAQCRVVVSQKPGCSVH